MSWKTGGFMEHGLGTATPEPWLELLLHAGAWECLWEGPGTAQPLWPTGLPRPDHEWLLHRKGTDAGSIRLFQFVGSTTQNRPGSVTWDTGGFFDIDLRVRCVDEWCERLSTPDWRGLSTPVNWQLGDLQVREWLVQGLDGVILALIERRHPPLEPAMSSGLSHAFNASQVVRDMDRSLAFYRALGFDVLHRQREPLHGGGGKILGLSAEEADATPVDLAMLSADGALNGSIELIAFPTRTGQDLSDSAGPGRRGLNLMRIPVRGLESLALDLERQNIPVESMARWECPPHGVLRGLALRSPDNAWLELLEVE